MFDAEIEPKSRDLLVLERATERIARGWVQNTLRCERGVCILGALAEETILDFEMEDRLLAVLGLADTVEANLRVAAEWNDAPGRTQAEVLQCFDAAIDRLMQSKELG